MLSDIAVFFFLNLQESEENRVIIQIQHKSIMESIWTVKKYIS